MEKNRPEKDAQKKHRGRAVNCELRRGPGGVGGGYP